MSRAGRTLRGIRALHTAVWGVFASAILAIPVATWTGRLLWAAYLSLFVCFEAVLAVNHMRCPLTIAGRYTDDRADNFDIFLPVWLARYNKWLFGSLFAVAEVYLLWSWITA